MVRTISTAKLKSQMRQAQHKMERQLKQIQRNTERKMKNELNKAVNKYNRELSRNAQRIQNELKKLNNSNMNQTKYISSVKKLNSSYNLVNSQYHEVDVSPIDSQILGYIELENANSLSVANAVENSEVMDTIDIELHNNNIGEKLISISSDWNDRWEGALYSLNPNNPDATRHFCTSTREIFTDIFSKYAPDNEVLSLFPNCDKTNDGNPTRKSKIQFFLFKKGINIKNIDEFIDEDVTNILELYRTLNNGTHGKAGRYSMAQLKLIKKRVEDGINFLCGLIA